MDSYSYPTVDSTPNDRSVSRKDELTYRNTLEQLANRCLLVRGTYGIDRAVSSFRTALFISVPGLPFRDRILDFEKELDQAMEDFKNKKIKKLSKKYIWSEPKTLNDLEVPDRAILKIKLYFAYNHTKLDFLLQLLAEHNALLRAKEYVETGEPD